MRAGVYLLPSSEFIGYAEAFFIGLGGADSRDKGLYSGNIHESGT